MWIMLTKKIAVHPSPPKMSIFWSTPWSDKRYAAEQLRRCKNCGTEATKIGGEMVCGCNNFAPIDEHTDLIYSPVGFGMEHNWVGARKIRYKSSDIRVFPDEFSTLEPERMRQYVAASHELVIGEVPEDDTDQKLLAKILRRDEMGIRDAALVDGCDPQQAKLVALGMDFTLPDAEFPAIGWYRCRKEYASVYSHDWELEE